MRFNHVAAVAMVGWLAWVGTARADNPNDLTTYQGPWHYRMAGIDKPFDTAEDACKAYASSQASKNTGKDNKFDHVTPGTSWSQKTCWYKDHKSKDQLWNQDNSVTKSMDCPDGSTSISSNNSGSEASQVCRCPNGSQCVSCKMGAWNPACSTPPPRGPDTSKRCQAPGAPASPVTPAAAAQTSAANSAAVDPKVRKAYDAAKASIQQSEFAKRSKQYNKPDANPPTQLQTNGFPEWDPSSYCPGVNDVNIGTLCGTDAGDFAAANAVAGYPGATPPAGCTWHHHEDLGRFLLLKSSDHSAAQHTGGRAIWKQAMGIKDYPQCCPTLTLP